MATDEATPVDEPIIRVRGLVNRFGEQVVHDGVDLDVRAGEIIGVVGGSGTGKSVLMRSILGLHTPDAGEMEVLKRSKRDVEAWVAVLGPNDWFGEMSILDVMPRSATVRAIAPSRTLRVTAHDLDALYRRDLKSYTLLVLNIAREMSRHDRDVNPSVKGSGRMRAVLGIYFSEEPFGDQQQEEAHEKTGKHKTGEQT